MKTSDEPERRTDPVLLLILLCVFGAITVAVLALLDSYGTFHRWRYPPAPPLEVEAVVPKHSPLKLLPLVARVGSNGWLTILHAPPTPAKPMPVIDGQPLPSPTASGADLDPVVAGAIKAFFRTRPQSRDDRLVTKNMDYRYTQLRLVLVDGCFRANGPRGPLAVFPPRTRLFVDGRYLSVGVPGSPDMKARVGEELFWEGDALQIIERNSLERIHSICGPGAVLQVVPSSASVFAARQDAGAAMAFQRSSKGVSWDEAVRAVQSCDRRLEASIRRENARAPGVLVSNTCGSPLVSPAKPGNCPPGTRFERSNCYDEKGLVAPVAAPPVPAQPPPASSR